MWLTIDGIDEKRLNTTLFVFDKRFSSIKFKKNAILLIPTTKQQK